MLGPHLESEIRQMLEVTMEQLLTTFICVFVGADACFGLGHGNRQQMLHYFVSLAVLCCVVFSSWGQWV